MFPFQSGNALLENILGGIHDTGVNVPQFLEGKKIGRMFGAVKHVRRSPMNRHRAGGCGRIRFLAAMPTLCFKYIICIHFYNPILFKVWNYWMRGRLLSEVGFS
jgi:hypothetical protein